MDISSAHSLRVSLSLRSSRYPIMSTSKSTVYFGYGSNLWLDQMRRRCPHSEYLGIARLKKYRWIIYDRGYANIVEEDEDEDTADKHDYTHEVWGLVYRLQPSDEERLDGNEGVPDSYTKEMMPCEFWPAGKDGKPADISAKPEKEEMLVYINRDLTTPSKSKEEYVRRMNLGIKDAVKEGVPEEYVKQTIRKYIPEEENEAVEVVGRTER